MNSPVLEIDRLVLDYPVRSAGSLFGKAGRFRAVDGVALAVPRGGALGLVGESGSGKSSVARTVMGLEKPTEGRVRILGRDLASMAESELSGFRRHFQMVFQDPYGSLNPRHSVGRSIAEPTRASGPTVLAQVHEMLRYVGLKPEDASRYPHEFSGGQRQRVAIARALITRPDLVVADEPVSALDLSVQAQVLNLLKDLRAELGLTYLFISHDLSVVQYICDDVAVMYAGRIVERGVAAAVLSAPLHPYTRALREAMPRPDRPGRRSYRSSGKLLGDAGPSPDGCAYRARCPLAAPQCGAIPTLRSLPDSREVACHRALELIDERGETP